MISGIVATTVQKNKINNETDYFQLSVTEHVSTLC